MFWRPIKIVVLVVWLFTTPSYSDDKCGNCDDQVLCASKDELIKCYSDGTRCKHDPSVNNCQFHVLKFFCADCDDACFYNIPCMDAFPMEIKWLDSAKRYWQGKGCILPSESICPTVLSASKASNIQLSENGISNATVILADSKTKKKPVLSNTVIGVIAGCSLAAIAVLLRLRTMVCSSKTNTKSEVTKQPSNKSVSTKGPPKLAPGAPLPPLRNPEMFSPPPYSGPEPQLRHESAGYPPNEKPIRAMYDKQDESWAHNSKHVWNDVYPGPSRFLDPRASRVSPSPQPFAGHPPFVPPPAIPSQFSQPTSQALNGNHLSASLGPRPPAVFTSTQQRHY